MSAVPPPVPPAADDVDDGLEDKGVHRGDEFPGADVWHAEVGGGGADRAGGGDVAKELGFAGTEGGRRGVGEAQAGLEEGSGAWHGMTIQDGMVERKKQKGRGKFRGRRATAREKCYVIRDTFLGCLRSRI